MRLELRVDLMNFTTNLNYELDITRINISHRNGQSNSLYLILHINLGDFHQNLISLRLLISDVLHKGNDSLNLLGILFPTCHWVTILMERTVGCWPEGLFPNP